MHWPEEETSTTPDQKHISTPASSWRGWSLWLRILGVAVALVGNVALALLGTQDFQSLSIVLLILVGAVSASLIRSWWSLLIVPVVFSLGFVLSASFPYGFSEFFSNLLSYFTLFFAALVEIGVLIGTPIGKKIEQQLRQ